MKNFKKIVAFGMTMVMLIGSSLSAMATEDTTSTDTPYDEEGTNTIAGNGSYSGIIPMDVVTVKVSTHTGADMDFVLDPQMLIYESVFNDIEGAANTAYDKDYFDENLTEASDPSIPTAYFKKYQRTINEIGVVSDNTAKDYKWTDTSTPIYAINKGLNDVNVGLKAAVTVDEGIEISANKAFNANYKKPSIYVGIRSKADAGNGTAGDADAAILGNSAKVTAIPTTATAIKQFNEIDKNVLGKVLGGTNGNVSVSYNGSLNGGKGGYELISAGDGQYFKHIGFELEAAANPYAIWKSSDLSKTPKVDLTWDFTPVATATVTLDNTGKLEVKGMTKEENAGQLDMYISDGMTVLNFADWAETGTDLSKWSAEEGGDAVFQFPETHVNYLKDGNKTLTVVCNFTNGTTRVVSTTF